MELEERNSTAKQTFTRIGIALLITGAAAFAVSYLLGFLSGILEAQGTMISDEKWFKWVTASVPMYVIGIPVGLLILKKLPAPEQKQIPLGGKYFFLFLLMCFPLMIAGNLIGTLLSSLLSGGTSTNAVIDFAFDKSPLKLYELSDKELIDVNGGGLAGAVVGYVVGNIAGIAVGAVKSLKCANLGDNTKVQGDVFIVTYSSYVAIGTFAGAILPV